MNIIYLSDSIIPSNSANSIHVMRMCEAFANLGHRVCLVGLKGEQISGDVFEYYGIEDKFEIKLNKVPSIPGKLYIHALMSMQGIKRFKPDFVFGRSFHSIALYSRLYKGNYSFESHDPFSSLASHFQYSFKKILSGRCFVELIVISEALKMIILNELAIPDQQIKALHDGATVQSEEGEISVQFNDRQGSLRIGYFGTLSKGRGVEVLIECAKRLNQFSFYLFGGTKSDLKMKLGINDLPENLYCFGFIPPSETQAVRKNCDILIAPYQKNLKIKSGKNTSAYMSPVKIFEYMSSNKPIIASDLVVLREVLNEENCILVAPNDIELWVEAIKKLQNSELRAELANVAYNDFIESYTWKKRAENVLKNIKL